MPECDPGASPNARFLAGGEPAAGTPRGRIGNALSLSLLTHVGAFLFVALVMSRLPVDNPQPNASPETPPHVTWIARAGDGGGGSGNARPEPARRAELPGREAVTLPVSQPAARRTDDPPKPEQPLQIPAVMTMSGAQELPGIVSALTPVSFTSSQGPGSGGLAGQGKGTGSGPDPGAGLGSGRNRGTGGEVYQNGGNGIVSPRLIREIKPGYTPEAMRAKIQGLVTLQAVVLPDGSVGAARIVRSLDSDFGLDQEALNTVKLWRFIPGTLAGRAVAVLVEIELTFTLR